MASWPATLPKPQAPGYSLNPVDQTARTDMEVGAARTRRRTRARNDKVNVEYVMTDAQMAIFRTWFENDSEAAGGASWFTNSLAIGTTGIVSVESKFVGTYKAVILPGLKWSVTAELEIR